MPDPHPPQPKSLSTRQTCFCCCTWLLPAFTWGSHVWSGSREKHYHWHRVLSYRRLGNTLSVLPVIAFPLFSHFSFPFLPYFFLIRLFFSFLFFLLLSPHRMFHFLLSLLLYFLLFFQCLFSMFLLCFLSMKLILNQRKQGRCPTDDSVLAVPKLPKLCYLKVCIHILQNFQFSHAYCLLLWYHYNRPTCIINP